jgi:colicin import membrane protein
LWWALGVHGLLLLALAFSMNWKLSDTAPVEAEIWSEVPRVAGGATLPPQAAVPRVVRRASVEAVEPEPTSRREPDLVIAKAKPEPKKAQARTPEPVAKPSKVTAPQSPSLSAVDLEAQRDANIQRMMASLGGAAGGPGTAVRSSGPSAGYAGRIIARIKPNIVFTESLNGNPHAVVEVRCTPDGRIMSRRLLTPSGVSSWDEAVLRALDRTEVLPPDVDDRVPSLMQLSFKLRDF